MASLLSRVDQISYQKFCVQPVARLGYYLAQAINANKKFMDILGGSTAVYDRDDWDIRQTPGVSIYYAPVKTPSMFWFKKGNFILKFQFPSDQVRERMHEITATMVDFTDTFLQDLDIFFAIEAKLPGLRELGFSTTWDPSKSEKLNEDNMLILPGTVSFSVDLLVWRKYIIENLGADPIDPCNQIYSDVTGYELFVTPSVFT